MHMKPSMNNRNSFLAWVFRLGQGISGAIEAGTIGFLPLILFILEILSAHAEASLVAQVMPYFGDSYIKALIYTGAGMGAGIYLAPSLSWYSQSLKLIKDIQNEKMLNPEFRAETLENLTVAKNRFAWSAFVTLCVAVSSHAVTIFFMITAFSSDKTLQMLKIQGMGEVPMVLAIAVSVMGFMLDIMLGLTTSVRLQLEDYYPSVSRKELMLEAMESYEEQLLEQAKAHAKIMDLREKRAKEVGDLNKKYDKGGDKGGDKKDEKKDENKNENKDENKDGNRDRKDESKEFDTSLHDSRDIAQFYEQFFNSKVKAADITKKLADITEKDFKDAIAVPLTQNFSELKRALGDLKNASEDYDKKKIVGKLKNLKNSAVNLLKKLGLDINGK
jgi:hypothetical protein